MADVQTVDRATARRFLVRRHLLAPPRSLPPEPGSVKTVVERLGSLQFDPLDVTGRNHDLVLAARIDGYRREWTDDLLYQERWLYEAYNKGLSLLPTSELPYYRIGWDRYSATNGFGRLDEHGELASELLERIRAEGTLSSKDVEVRESIDWYWRPTNQVRAILEALALSGVLGIARRDGNRRLYDLSERLFPAELLAERRTEPEQLKHKLLSRYRAHGLLGMRGGGQEVWIGTSRTAADRYLLRDELIEEGLLLPVSVEGVKGDRVILADEAGLLADTRPLEPGVALLAPLDPLVWDREVLRSLWDFDYLWEVYVPAAKRRWGYYVLPLLWGERFVGRIEPRIERKTGTLRVLGLWWEDGFEPLDEPGFVEELAAALRAHALFLGATKVVLPRTARNRALVAELRPRLDLTRDRSERRTSEVDRAAP
ncbi:MAG TPA: crosslink repair DNA glycosylase YcaQ family protein [Gaiella sp.]|nr:crosslink repair DNA glycosylase YcaQ family protein [Gaiella sp.]